MIIESENMWVRLGKLQLNVFGDNPQAYFELLVTGLTQRVILSMFYFVLVRMRRIIPVEELSESDKADLWESAKEIAADRLDKNKTIELSKCLYIIQEFMTK
jgi:hypothetical protein